MITRREFLRNGTLAAGGLTVGARLAWAQSPRVQATEFNAWIHLGSDGRFRFVLDKAEMGQGVMTGLTAIVAEELDIYPHDVEVVFAPPGNAYANAHMFHTQITGGSTSVASSFDNLRFAAASVKALLVAAACQKLKCRREALTPGYDKRTRTHYWTDILTGKRVQWGEIAERAASFANAPANVAVKPKPRSQYRLLGKKNILRLDAWDKVTGRAKFGIDMPAALNCAIVRSPVSCGKLVDFEPSRASELGVLHLLRLKGGLAVVAKTTWEAQTAAEKIRCRWDYGPAARPDSKALSAQYGEASRQRGQIASLDTALYSDRKLEAELAKCTRQLDVTYELPYAPHATMEPMNATVHFRGDSCEMWIPTQAPAAAAEVTRQITGLPISAIKVNTTFLGGGFGRRIYQDFVAEAVSVALQLFQQGVSQPVKVTWSRVDDFQHDYYRPKTVHRVRGGLNNEGTIGAWLHHVVGQSIFTYFASVFVDSLIVGFGSPQKVKEIGRVFGEMMNLKPITLPGGARVGLTDPTSVEGLVTGAVPPNLTHVPFARRVPYAIDTFHVENTVMDSKVPVGFWRSVGHSHTAFAIECFVDELARLSGRDPVAFRLFLLEEARKRVGLLNQAAGALKRLQRATGVLQAVREASQWGRCAEGCFQGVAQHESFDTFCAVVVEASVLPAETPPGASISKSIKVHRVYVAVDCGFVLTPDLVRAQAEGAVIYGLTAALKQEITFKDGRVEQSGFHDCDLLRMHECPAIDVTIVASDEAPSGIGEPVVPPVAPALRNAVYAATGIPLRKMPLRLS